MKEKNTHYKRKKRMIRIVALVIVALLLLGMIPALNGAWADSDGMIRVKLTRLGTPTTVAMTTVGGYTVNGKAIASGASVKVVRSGSSLTLTAGGQQLASGTSITMMRTGGGTGTGVRFTSPSLANLFCGDLTFTVSGSGIQTVLSIYIETYLYGVVPYEMSNSFPIEALKAQTIAARTYAMRAKRSGGSYDVTDNTSSQVFKGYTSSYGNAISAVDNTRGVVLMSGSSYAQCYYTASNGGQTESTANAWGSSISYLTVKDDPYDRENPNSIEKSHSISRHPQSKALHSGLESALISAAASQLKEKGLSADASDVTIEEIVDVDPHTPKYSTPSRTYTKLRFTMKLSSKSGSTGNQISTQVEVDLNTYSSLQSMLNLSINSGDNEIVSVEKNDQSFTLTFSRYGHGIGLSQRGAQWMAKQYDKSYEEILDFYYPGTKQTKLTLKETVGGSSAVEPAPTRVPTETEDGYTTLQEGDSGQAVKELQIRLKELGYFTGATLGNYRTLTMSAVKAYQKAMGLTEDGIATPKLQKMIFAEQQNTQAPQATQKPADTGVQATVSLKDASSWLNVRKQASASSAVVGELKHGTKVSVLGESGDWRQISSGSVSGYVKAEYLKYAEEDAQQPETDGEYQTLQYGDSSDAVRALQEQLKKLGYFSGQTLGNYRTQTTAAVKAYQEAMGLEADGVATPELQKMIFEGRVPAATPAPEGSQSVRATVALGNTSSRLNVRREPSTSAGIAGTLRHGEKVTVLESSGGWSRIQSSNLTGYVMTNYLVGEAGALPTATPTPQPTNAPSDGMATVELSSASSRLNVRKSPGTASAVVGTLRHGMQVEVMDTSDGWCWIKSGSLTGYVVSRYLKTADGNEPADEPDATRTPESSAETGVATIRLRSSSSRLNVRKEASTTSSIVGTLRHGAQVEVQGRSGDWSRIKSGSLTGYVMSSYLIMAEEQNEPAATPAPEESQPVSTATIRLSSASSLLNVRRSASTSAAIEGTLKHGTQVEVYGRSGEWTQIRSGSLTGYVMTKYLSEASSAPEQTPSQGQHEESEYTTLSYGSTGEAVKRLQKKLKELGYFTGELGGNYLTLTQSAVEAYQKDHGRTADGVATPELQKAIFGETGTSFTANASVAVSSDNYLNLRKSATTASAVVTTMKGGERVYAERAEDGWYRVQTQSGLKGYAKQEYIRMDN